MTSSIYWHDYETFGANPQLDRPAQFAGIRTDSNLNIIEDPTIIYCRPSDDYLPHPEACLITGITPQKALREGICEKQFIKIINDKMSVPETCVAGYNSIRFDDEVTRNALYRNFFDPYEREWKNGNSRWDIIDVLRMTHALRPENISWPEGDDGLPSFRLELITEANGISHQAAHDAMSDVYATIDVAKLLRNKKSELYRYAFEHRKKETLFPAFNVENSSPLIHVSSKFPARLGCIGVVAPLCRHPHNKNGIIVFDTRQNAEILEKLDVNEIRELLYKKSDQLRYGEVRPALKTVHLNKCPVILPASMVKTIPEERLKSWEIDLDAAKKNIQYLRDHPDIAKKIQSVFEERDARSESDPDLMIYSGGFFNEHDKQQIRKVCETDPYKLEKTEFLFRDSRLSEMLFRYRARNYPDTLNSEDQEKWSQFCQRRLMAPENGQLSLEQYFDLIQALYNEQNISLRDKDILEELKIYGESLIPYD